MEAGFGCAIPRSVVENADFPRRFPQQAGDAEGHVPQERDLDARVGLFQRLEIVPLEQVTLDVGLRPDHRGARGSVEHGDLAKGHSGGKHAQAPLCAVREGNVMVADPRWMKKSSRASAPISTMTSPWR